MRMLLLWSVIAAGACASAPRTVPVPVRLIVFDGNSLTNSRGGVPAYPSLLAIPTNITTANVSARGSTTVEQDALAATAVDALHRDGLCLVVMWEGANDLYFGATAEQAIDHLRQYAARRRAAGFVVLLASLLPRSDAGLSPNYEARRQAVNTWLRAHHQEIADGFIDIGRDPAMGAAGQELNRRYYLPDRVHLAAGGARRVARLVAAALHPYDARIRLR